MEPPIILINDWSDGDGDPVGIRYIRGFNDIKFQITYENSEKFEGYPKCEHEKNEYDWPCKSCYDTFTKVFWSTCATILDYFADFHHIDTPGMHSIWFQVLGVWQEAALWLRCEEIIESGSRVKPAHIYIQAVLFDNAFDDAIKLIQTVVDGEMEAGTPTEPFIYRASFEQKCGAGTYEHGVWEPGLKPWEQFLSARSPGVALPSSMDTEFNVNNEGVRYVPMAAIAIVEKLTERTRELATKLAEEEPESGTEILNTFNQHCLKFPTGSQNHTYTSMNGNTVTYQLENGAPPFIRDTGYHDPDADEEKPDFQLVDEYLARCMGVPAYVPRSGSDEEVENGLAFDLWAVRETESTEEEGGARSEPAIKGLDKMFDYWCEDAESHEW